MDFTVYPALDIRDGRVVRLAQGDYARETRYGDDPLPRALAFAQENGVPINPLHAQGFVSIGCQPCTRAIRPGEPERAGRWWWEDDAAKECGLHVGQNGKPARAQATTVEVRQ